MPAVFAAYPNALLVVKLMKKPCGCFDFLQCRFVLRCNVGSCCAVLLMARYTSRAGSSNTRNCASGKPDNSSATSKMGLCC